MLDKSLEIHQFQVVGLIYKQLQLGEQAGIELTFRMLIHKLMQARLFLSWKPLQNIA